jgi:hypothetical protein
MVEGKDKGFVEYLYDGEYDYYIPFAFQEETDLALELRLGIQVLPLVLNTDYTIYEVDTNFFVSLTVDAVYPFEPETLSIKRDMELTQLYHFDSGEPVARGYLEKALDRLILLIQAMTRNISGALFFPTNEDVDAYLPNNVLRRGNFLSFDDQGSLTLWRNGYNKITTDVLHEPALLTDNATDHNTHYGTNDKEQFLPAQEGQIKSSFIASLVETAPGPHSFIEGSSVDLDFMYIEGGIVRQAKGIGDNRFRTPIDPDMIFLVPAGNPDGLTYGTDTAMDNTYPMHDPSLIEAAFYFGSTSHTISPSLGTQESYVEAHNWSGEETSSRTYDCWVYTAESPLDPRSHFHLIPSHVHPDAAPNELTRAQFHAANGFTSLVPGMHCLSEGPVPAGFIDVSASYLNRYIKFVPKATTTTLVSQVAHTHGEADDFWSAFNNNENALRLKSIGDEFFYTGQPDREGGHQHVVWHHTAGAGWMENPCRNYKLLKYVGTEIDYLPAECMVFLTTLKKQPLGLDRVYGEGLSMRISPVSGTASQAWHTHAASFPTGMGYYDSPWAGQTKGVVLEAPLQVGEVVNASIQESHRHGWYDLHTDDSSRQWPYSIRINLFKSTATQKAEYAVPAEISKGGIVGSRYGLAMSKTVNTNMIRLDRQSAGSIKTFQYSAGVGFTNVKMHSYLGGNALIAARAVSKFPGHMVVYGAGLDVEAFSPLLALETANLNVSNSDYCVNTAGDELYHLLGNGVLNVYDLLSMTLDRAMVIPDRIYQAEWSDYYYGIIAMTDIAGVYTMLYIRPLEPGVAVYICDSWPGALAPPKITTLGKDGGICAINGTGFSPVARFYFDLDKSYDFTLLGAGAISEVKYLEKTSTIKIVGANKTYSTLQAPDIKTDRQVVKSYIPYVDKAVTEWTG